jgi:hypothetical protein
MLKNHFDPNYPLFPHFARFLHGWQSSNPD